MRLVSRQNVVWVVLLLLFFCAVSVYADGPSSDVNQKSIFSNPGSLSDSPTGSGTLDDNLNNTLSRMMLAVLIVIVLGAAAIYASKKVLPKLSHSQGKKIKIVETIHLGSRKTIHLLQISDRQILVGSTHDRITKLADIFSEKDFPLSHSDSSGADE